MARITVEDCLSRIGSENRFSLIHLAVARLKQHRKGQPFVVKGKNKEVVMALREIAAGEVTFDNIFELNSPAKGNMSENEEASLVSEGASNEAVTTA